MFDHYIVSASDLFTVNCKEPTPGMPTFANCVFSSKLRSANIRRGAGLYVIQYCQVPIYVGKFLGGNTSPFSGDILSARWLRHVSTISLRGTKLSISQTLQKRFIAANPVHPLAAGIAMAHTEVLRKDRGYQVAANRLAFAAGLWSVLSSAPSSWLSNFTFGYVQLQEEPWQDISSDQVWDAISAAEKLAITSMGPQVNAGNHIVRKNPVATGNVLALFEKVLRDALSQYNLDPAKDVSAGYQEFREGLQDEEDYPGDQFWENLPSESAEAVRSMLKEIEPENVEVHYTHTNDGDLRVRVLGVARPRNIFTCFFQPRVQRLHCRAMIAAADVAGRAGIEGAKPCKASEPLWSEFKVDATVAGSAADLADIVRTAISNMRENAADPRGAIRTRRARADKAAAR